jgi:glycosyltransferase involved in cell wall biosynthesis
VALPRAWEGWPLAAAEAIRAGVPLVCSDRPGLRALAGEAAVYVPVGDPTALRHAVERVLSDATLRGDMTAAGRRQRASWQSIDDAVDELVRIYLDVSSTSSQ